MKNNRNYWKFKNNKKATWFLICLPTDSGKETLKLPLLREVFFNSVIEVFNAIKNF